MDPARTDQNNADFSGRKSIGALFFDPAQAQAAICELEEAGFPQRSIGVAVRDRDAEGRLAEDTGASTLAGEGAVTGMASGTVVGGVIGLLVGIGAAVAVPGIGPAILGGLLGSTVTGAGIGAASGGLIGGLIGMGIPDREAAHLDQGFREGAVVVAVDALGRGRDAVEILRRNGGDFGPVDVESTLPATGEGCAELR